MGFLLSPLLPPIAQFFRSPTMMQSLNVLLLAAASACLVQACTSGFQCEVCRSELTQYLDGCQKGFSKKYFQKFEDNGLCVPFLKRLVADSDYPINVGNFIELGFPKDDA